MVLKVFNGCILEYLNLLVRLQKKKRKPLGPFVRTVSIEDEERFSVVLAYCHRKTYQNAYTQCYL